MFTYSKCTSFGYSYVLTHVKKDKMVEELSEADTNANVITAKIIIMLL